VITTTRISGQRGSQWPLAANSWGLVEQPSEQRVHRGERNHLSQEKLAFEGSFQVDLQALSCKLNLATVAGEGLQGGRKSKIKINEIPF